MNPDIKTMIDGYAGTIKLYADKVPPDSVNLKKVTGIIDEMNSLGKSCAEIWDFMNIIKEKDLLNRYTVAITELATESISSQKKSGTMKIPSASDAALGYHKAYEAIDPEKQKETAKIYERIFEIENDSKSASEFLSRMAQEKLFIKMSTVPLREVFSPLVKQAEDLSIPVMAFHNSKMIELADNANSSVELECDSQKLLEFNRMEIIYDQIFVSDLFYTLGNKVSDYLLVANDENAKRVKYCASFIADFFGMNMDEILSNPRIDNVIKNVIIKNLGGKYTQESYKAEFKQVVLKCSDGKDPVPGPASRKNCVFWGKNIPISELQTELRNPSRPF